MKKVLLADKLPEQCIVILKEAGLEVDYRPGLSEDELREAIRDASGVICRSGARLTEGVLEGAERLEAICRAGVGVDNVDVEAASRKGVVVMNTPGANTISTAEHAFTLMLGVARNIGPAYVSMREGHWEKERFVGSQLAGSVLGVIGLGRIGQEVARRAAAFGMTVRTYDPFIGREAAAKVGAALLDNLEDLLEDCDYLTIHVPENEQTRGMIGAEQIALMKENTCIVNCSRGSVVDQDAVVAAVEAGRLGGAAFDVYAKEPPDSYEFTRHDRVLATPHLGASTEEAQLAVATQAARQLIEALERRHFPNALNVSELPPEEMKAIRPYCDLAAQLGKLVAQLTPGRPQAIEIACTGQVARENIEPIVNYGAMGVMQSSLDASVNIVSSPHLARDRGIRITGSSTVGLVAGFTDLIEVKLVADEGTVEVGGTLFGPHHPRIVCIAGFYVEIIPKGHVLAVFGSDVPGLIGTVGAMLGDAGVNIARMGFGRQEAGGKALLALNLDMACDEATLDRLRALDLIEKAIPVEL
ncbi:MAG: phosphoglycerate dehydrogenase [Candidatus Brocadiae bacterium]|nr:phosphoglycerate dehydrogenase [Candidatus Brocadiia bacterium]